MKNFQPPPQTRKKKKSLGFKPIQHSAFSSGSLSVILNPNLMYSGPYLQPGQCRALIAYSRGVSQVLFCFKNQSFFATEFKGMLANQQRETHQIFFWHSDAHQWATAHYSKMVSLFFQCACAINVQCCCYVVTHLIRISRLDQSLHNVCLKN